MILAKHKRRGFSLIELVIVVVIIAIIAAIAVPKMSRGAAGASEAALMQNLSQMRSAIEMFVAEHSGNYPSQTPATFIQQMQQYTDANGVTSPTKGNPYIYGPYLKSIPPLPLGANKGSAAVTYAASPGTGAAGWCYDGTTIWANLASTEVDAKNAPYNGY